MDRDNSSLRLYPWKVEILSAEIITDGQLMNRAVTPPVAHDQLRVLHSVLALDVGGLERIVLQLCRIGNQLGQNHQVLCVESVGGLASAFEHQGISTSALHKPPGRDKQYISRARDVLQALKPHVVHTHVFGAAWYVGKAARSLGIPVVHTEHGNWLTRTSGLVARVKAALFVHDAARCIDRLCCVSHEIANTLTHWHLVPASKICVVPNGIDTSLYDHLPERSELRQQLGIAPDEFILGTVGRLNEVKRQDLMLQVLAQILKTRPRTRLLIVGDGPERSRLEKLAADLNVASKVLFVGYQERPEAYMQIMDLFLLTSRSEGFPVSLLEAWLGKVPAVLTAVGGIPKIVEDGIDGCLAPAGDVEGLVQRSLQIMNDPAFAARLVASADAKVRQRYSLESLARQYETIYNQAIVSRGQ